MDAFAEDDTDALEVGEVDVVGDCAESSVDVEIVSDGFPETADVVVVAAAAAKLDARGMFVLLNPTLSVVVAVVVVVRDVEFLENIGGSGFGEDVATAADAFPRAATATAAVTWTGTERKPTTVAEQVDLLGIVGVDIVGAETGSDAVDFVVDIAVVVRSY